VAQKMTINVKKTNFFILVYFDFRELINNVPRGTYFYGLDI
jgi:hypothetical protein